MSGVHGKHHNCKAERRDWQSIEPIMLQFQELDYKREQIAEWQGQEFNEDDENDVEKPMIIKEQVRQTQYNLEFRVRSDMQSPETWSEPGKVGQMVRSQHDHTTNHQSMTYSRQKNIKMYHLKEKIESEPRNQRFVKLMGRRIRSRLTEREADQMENREIRKRAINIEDSPDEKENEMLTVDKVLNDPVIKD